VSTPTAKPTSGFCHDTQAASVAYLLGMEGSIGGLVTNLPLISGDRWVPRLGSIDVDRRC